MEDQKDQLTDRHTVLEDVHMRLLKSLLPYTKEGLKEAHVNMPLEYPRDKHGLPQ